MAPVASILTYVLVAGLVYALLRLLGEPARALAGLGLRAILGAAVLWLANRVGESFGVTVGLNPVTALVAGTLGLPGTAVLFVLAYFALS